VSKPARRRRVRGGADPCAIWNYDPKTRLTEFIDDLMNVPGPASIAGLELGENANGMVDGAPVSEFEMQPVVVGAKEANDLDIAAAKEDLVGYTPALLEGLEAIPDEGDRRRAYDALCFVLNATYRVGRSTDPLNELQRSQDKQMAVMQAHTGKKLAERDKIVLSVVDEHKSSKLPLSAGRLLAAVNERLIKEKHKEISAETYYRILRGRLPAKK
jgi:hypothetical protein